VRFTAGKMKVRFLEMPLILFLIIFSLHCDKIRFGKQGELLKRSETYSLKIPQPSGLSVSYDGKYLWTVSDHNSSIYLITFNGKTVKKFKVDAKDLEGITTVDENTLAVVSEETNEIVLIDTSGNELLRKKMDVATQKNSGLEGITYSRKTNRFYVVNEKYPTALIELDSNLEEINRIELDILRDLSGLSYDEQCDCLWILSDEDKSIIKYSLDEGAVENYRIDVVKAEGISVYGDKIYIVSDETEKLYVFEIE
jgi:uncharacterized protein YjiK